MSVRAADKVISKAPEHLRSEIAVVGSGPGGAIMACTLAEAGRDVLLIEEGPYLPLDSCVPFSRQEMIQKYRNRGVSAAIGSPKVVYVEADLEEFLEQQPGNPRVTGILEELRAQ